MTPTSPPKSLNDLATRLKKKKEEDRLLIQKEVAGIVLNLKSSSEKSANTIRSDIESRAIKRWTRTLAGMSMGTVLLASVLALTLWYLTSEVLQTKSALEMTRISLAAEKKSFLELEESIRTESGLSLGTDKTGGIWLQLRPGLTWGQSLRANDGTSYYQILRR